MEKLPITKGIWIAESIDVYIETNDPDNFGENIAQAYDGKDTHISNMDYEIAEANAKLIADAGTTYNKCGILPSDLLKANNELLEALNDILLLTTGYKHIGVKALKKAEQLIQTYKHNLI